MKNLNESEAYIFKEKNDDQSQKCSETNMNERWKCQQKKKLQQASKQTTSVSTAKIKFKTAKKYAFIKVLAPLL